MDVIPLTGPKRPREPRVVVACQRCKSRKQKCNGEFPSCAKCASLGIACEYKIPDKPMPFGKNQYIRCLEQRIADLEAYIQQKGFHESEIPVTPFSVQSRKYVLEDHQPGQETPEGLDETPEPLVEKRKLEDDTRGVDSMTDLLRDLSLDANGGYIGASSYISIGRLIGDIVQEPRAPQSQSRSPSKKARKAAFPPQEALAPIARGPLKTQNLAAFDSAVLDQLLNGYMKYVATHWPVLHSTWIREVHAKRNSNLDNYEYTMLHLVYAVAGQFLHTTGPVGNLQPERHYALAHEHVDELLQYRDIRSVQALMLLAIYSLRTSAGVGAWAYCRLALLIAIDLGLHRKGKPDTWRTIDDEMRKRIFWSCYAFDVQVSMPLGRPTGISDRDIDIPLPLEVEEHVSDPELLAKANGAEPTRAPDTGTPMSAFNHIVRLRKIESEVQQTVYRVDRSEQTPTEEVERILAKLGRWQTLIPRDAYTATDQENVPFDGVDYYMIFFWKCVRLLLYPQIAGFGSNPRYLKPCATACGNLCQTYKRLHQSMSIAYSMMSLQSVFMAGITLVYCVWASPQEFSMASVNDDVSACSVVLFVMVERLRTVTAKKYRDAFELVRHKVLDHVGRNAQHVPRQQIATLNNDDDFQSTIRQLGEEHDDDDADGCLLNFTHILTEIAGEQFNHNGGGSDRPSHHNQHQQPPQQQSLPLPPPGLTPSKIGVSHVRQQQQTVEIVEQTQTYNNNNNDNNRPTDSSPSSHSHSHLIAFSETNFLEDDDDDDLNNWGLIEGMTHTSPGLDTYLRQLCE
ncbi:hypothetical protein AYL99_06263 [Fonsecaea erecta]|uniref:Zn(2)-C6 fungal-type domain-containing protein n=1 Tax=Fonsecaea erecta TaxID=1367422 RepID=A0A178ZHP4_9EURO|nr:hypothetical protein AYL99_06263 [Fonsecaea erecta]OAP58966.1 hypothetical protein AYL99_06263 [Fonsecaea erecta]